MSAYETREMVGALPDVTNAAATNGAGPVKNVEAAKEARDKGWVEPQEYDYSAAAAPPTGVAQAVDQGAPSWAHNAVKYEWQEDFGDVGPKIPELEEQLFRSEFLNRKGLKFDDLCAIKVTAEAEEKPAPISDVSVTSPTYNYLADHDSSPKLASTPSCSRTLGSVVMSTLLLFKLTPSRLFSRVATSLPQAQTGSGKTAAFLIPCLSKLMGKTKKLAAKRPNLANGFNAETDSIRAEPLILVVAPTRELCCQIFDEARRLCYRSMLRPCVAYGGGPMREQMAELAKGCRHPRCYSWPSHRHHVSSSRLVSVTGPLHNH